MARLSVYKSSRHEDFDLVHFEFQRNMLTQVSLFVMFLYFETIQDVQEKGKIGSAWLAITFFVKEGRYPFICIFWMLPHISGAKGPILLI